MTRSTSRSRWPGLIRPLAVFGLTVMTMATVLAQPPTRPTRKAPGKAEQRAPALKPAEQPTRAAQPAPTVRTYRYAPSLGVLMVAYEGVLQNNDRANPELVRAMRQTFQRNPSARRTMEKIHKAYRALPPADRVKVVGRELAQANGDTRLTRAVLEPIFTRHFRRAPTPLAEQSPATMRPADMTPVAVPDREMQLDPDARVPERTVPLRERSLGVEAKEGSSTTYRVDYSGLYCRQEPTDFSTHCEPYVILVMKQGDSQWTVRKGPYERCDSGDRFPERVSLRNGTPFRNDLYVVATVFEHDLGTPEEIEDAISTGVDALASIADIWWDVPNWLRDAVTDVVTWFADVFGLEDDQIGDPQSIRFTRSYAEAHTGSNSNEGIEYDTYLRCRGDMSGRRRQRGDFYVYLNVTPR